MNRSLLPAAVMKRLTKSLDTMKIVAFKKWLRALKWMAALVLIMMFLGFTHPTIGFHSPEPHGHLLWFLFILCLPMMPILGLLNVISSVCCGENSLEAFVLAHQFPVLGTVALIELFLLALIGRWILRWRNTALILNLACSTVWMIWGYGILCFIAFLVMIIWGRGGFSLY